MAESPAVPPSETPIQTAVCRYCAAPLRVNSVLCTECNQWQQLSKQFRASFTTTTVISLITTTVPVVVLAFAFMKTTLQDPRSSVQTNVLSCTREEVLVTVSNTGNRSAILLGGQAIMRDQDPSGPSERTLSHGGLPIVLKPGEPIPLLLEMKLNGPLAMKARMPSPQGKCAYEIRMNIVDFKGKRRTAGGQTCACA